MDVDLQKLLSRPTITVDDAAKVLGTGRNATYDAVHRGEIDTMRVGGRILVLTAPLRRKLGLEVAA
ncbi:excisionase family DNA-binding protein [Bradyrhizobium sp. SRL28]|uniref:helix-turn-helix domain-containing protein n=1 Tax=Bradyrhizobium sp. SRL28 TaxID=2836178 RepID=UPI001BDE79DC|nr:helix-turn-helix domain-containing protein [Bradyrhizobium sp. SRL28]MBT1516445.1 excisionase family DNA-binding protein [Bradyrhizobium sp. SRL28]